MTTPGLGQLTLDSSFNDVARAIVGESQRRKHTRDETIAELATAFADSGYRFRDLMVSLALSEGFRTVQIGGEE